MKKYVVGPKASIVLGNPPKLRKPQEELAPELVEKFQEKVDGLVGSGLVICFDDPGGNAGEAPAPVAEEPPAPVEKPPAEDPLRQGRGKWNFNPSKIKRRGVNRLNEMIAEEDPEAPAFETKEEAIAWLSQDFEA